MELRRRISGLPCLLAAVCVIAFLAVGCKSHKRSGTEAGQSDSPSSGSAQPSVPVGGTYCLDTFAHAPSQAKSIHFSYKENESDGSLKDFEGDLAGDNIDSTIHEKRPANDMDREMAREPSLKAPPIVNGFVDTTRSLHSTRSDPSGWLMGSGGQVHAFTPWSLFIAKPNVKQVGTENIAGFDAVKYSVDTDGQGQLEKMPLTLAGGLKDYTIQGTVWVDAHQQCILQYSIAYDQVLKDGSKRTTRYEGATTTR